MALLAAWPKATSEASRFRLALRALLLLLLSPATASRPSASASASASPSAARLRLLRRTLRCLTTIRGLQWRSEAGEVEDHGEYQPGNAEHPRRRTYRPDVPEAMHQNSVAGFAAALAYFGGV